MLTRPAYQPSRLLGGFRQMTTNPNLGAGFTLRCFQRLSFP